MPAVGGGVVPLSLIILSFAMIVCLQRGVFTHIFPLQTHYGELKKSRGS